MLSPGHISLPFFAIIDVCTFAQNGEKCQKIAEKRTEKYGSYFPASELHFVFTIFIEHFLTYEVQYLDRMRNRAFQKKDESSNF